MRLERYGWSGSTCAVLSACGLLAETWNVDQDKFSALRQGILDLLRDRRSDSTICPSEVARRLAPQGWRELMPLVREAARQLALEGSVELRQRGRPLSARAPWKGPIRIAPLRPQV